MGAILRAVWVGEYVNLTEVSLLSVRVGQPLIAEKWGNEFLQPTSMLCIREVKGHIFGVRSGERLGGAKQVRGGEISSKVVKYSSKSGRISLFRRRASWYAV